MRNVPCAGSYIKPTNGHIHEAIFRVTECGDEYLTGIACHPDGQPMAGAEMYPWTFSYGHVKDISHEISKSA